MLHILTQGNTWIFMAFQNYSIVPLPQRDTFSPINHIKPLTPFWWSTTFFLTSGSFCSSDARRVLNSTGESHSFWFLLGLIAIQFPSPSGCLCTNYHFFILEFCNYSYQKKHLSWYFRWAFVFLFLFLAVLQQTENAN